MELWITNKIYAIITPLENVHGTSREDLVDFKSFKVMHSQTYYATRIPTSAPCQPTYFWLNTSPWRFDGKQDEQSQDFLRLSNRSKCVDTSMRITWGKTISIVKDFFHNIIAIAQFS